jgi:hypothetical protein
VYYTTNVLKKLTVTVSLTETFWPMRIERPTWGWNGALSDPIFKHGSLVLFSFAIV